MPQCHADPQRQPSRTLDDLSRSAKHPFTVVTGADRGPRDQQDLPAARGDVGLEERHLVVGDRLGDVADAGVERFAGGVGTLPREQVVGAGERHEPDSYVTVLRLTGPLQQVLADRDREPYRQVNGVGGSNLGLPPRRRRFAPEQPGRRPDRLTEQVGVEQGTGGRRHGDLPGACDGLGLDHGGHVRAADEQLTVPRRVPHQEEVERPAVHTHGHPELHLAGAGRQPPDHAEAGAHPEGGAARALRVVVTVEEQQHGVAAPLHQVRAVRVGHAEQLGERHVQRVAHVLRPDLAEPRQSLGESREAGDVREDHRALDATVGPVRCRAEPVPEQP